MEQFQMTLEHYFLCWWMNLLCSPCCLPLKMDDGKSIRYKDLYALFEHILEKTMRQEQRDWRESPVKVWVNTFKVFLDEFMTEYKPMDSTISKVRTHSCLLGAPDVKHRRAFWLKCVWTDRKRFCKLVSEIFVFIMLIFLNNSNMSFFLQPVVKPERKKRRKKDADIVSLCSFSIYSSEQQHINTLVTRID